MSKVLYVDDEPGNLLTFELTLQKWYDIIVVKNPLDVISIIEQNDIGVLITDQRMPQMSGLELSALVAKRFSWLSIILLTAYDDSDMLIAAVNQGSISRYMQKPWNLAELRQNLENAIEASELRRANLNLIKDLENKNKELQKSIRNIGYLKSQLEKENVQFKQIYKDNYKSEGDIITQSPVLKSIINQLLMVSKTDTSILLLGETGTGKELFANLVHQSSLRSDSVLVKVNCAAIPENIVESELFGHDKGAFTGADKIRLGKFELANNGTLFLDEIGELPLNIQSKLLRVLQEGEFERVGGQEVIKTNFRLVAATNRNLYEAVKHNQFRSDLYYRINVLPVEIPPLRDRKEDILLLVYHFIDKFNREKGKDIREIPEKVKERLMNYAWPGNVRELRNVVERAHVLSQNYSLDMGDWFEMPSTEGVIDEPNRTLKAHEKQYILTVLRRTKWRIRGDGGAAQILDINPTTLESRMKKLGIQRPI